MAKANVGSLLVFDPATMGVEGPLPADAVVGIVTERGECERERRRAEMGRARPGLAAFAVVAPISPPPSSGPDGSGNK